MRPTAIYALTVLGSFLSAYAAQAEQSNSCQTMPRTKSGHACQIFQQKHATPGTRFHEGVWKITHQDA
jgi:hypothetical protein